MINRLNGNVLHVFESIYPALSTYVSGIFDLAKWNVWRSGVSEMVNWGVGSMTLHQSSFDAKYIFPACTSNTECFK